MNQHNKSEESALSFSRIKQHFQNKHTTLITAYKKNSNQTTENKIKKLARFFVNNTYNWSLAKGKWLDKR
jgi:hypothetical protein